MGGGGSTGVMNDINVTPLVDVMLVLLIIFMVTVPMMNQGVDIDLPKADAPPLNMEDETQLILSIDAELNFFINESTFTADEMPAKLAAIAEANPGAPIFVQADGDVPYREVARLLGAAKLAGFPRVGMVFHPEEG
ncbi:MAG: ExbD/TolR family protein [Proteobacteria bacterium]|nr:ExbD/TolR family protein [Pseudomonadota bacterium]